MLITQTNLDIWYNEYKKQYEKSTKYVRSRSGKTRGLKPLSRAAFASDFISEASDNPKLSGTKVAQKMAKAEVFPVSSKQASVFAQAHAKQFGGKVDINLEMSYRIGLRREQDLWTAIKERNRELDYAGLSGKARRDTIYQEFFAGTGDST